MRTRVLEGWAAAVDALGYPVSGWDGEPSSESLQFSVGEESYELVAGRDGQDLVVYLLHGMDFPLPAGQGWALAQTVNMERGAEQLLLECDEVNVLWVVPEVNVGSVTGASAADLHLAIREARLLRDDFLKRASLSAKATP